MQNSRKEFRSRNLKDAIDYQTTIEDTLIRKYSIVHIYNFTLQNYKVKILFVLNICYFYNYSYKLFVLYILDNY